MLLPRQDNNNMGDPPKRPSEIHDPNNPDHQHNAPSKGGDAGIAIGAFIILVILAFIAYYIYARLRARRLGLPPPGMNPFSDRNRVGGSHGGVVGWVSDKFSSVRRGREAGGAYEGSGGGAGLGGGLGGSRRGAGGRGFRGLDPDEAWDSRVQTEADYGYEEQELSLRNAPPRDEDTGYMGSSGYGNLGENAGLAGERSGRSELDERYDEEMGVGTRGRGGQDDPFRDPSLRGVSPRAEDRVRVSDETSRAERKSAFREGPMT